MNRAKSAFRGNLVPEKMTKNTGSQMVGAAHEIEWLSFDIQQDKNEKLKKVQSGELVLSKFGNLRLIVELEKPITHKDVLKKARRLKLI